MDGILKKIMKIKGIGYIALAVAAAIMILCLPSEKESAENRSPKADAFDEYASALERETESILAKISGVGECKVMITFENGFAYSYAADQTLQQSFGDNGKVLSSSAEKRYITVNSGGTSSPVELKKTMPKISGIAVICPKASDSTRLTVTETVKALFNLSSNRISVQS